MNKFKCIVLVFASSAFLLATHAQTGQTVVTGFVTDTSGGAP
jgi:hypothetical protein